MTVSSTTTRNSYSGDGSTTAFAYGFKIFASSDLTVILRSATGVETVQTETTHYTVSNVGVASGGNVTFGSAPASGVTVVIRRNSPLTQLTDYTPNDPFPADDHENALDKLTFIAQQQQEELDRSIKLSRTNTMTSTEFTTSATDRASKILAFDTSGELSVTQELGTFRGDFAASTAYNIRDLVKDTSTGNVFFVNEAHTSSGSEPLTSNANASKYSLILDATQGVTAGTVSASKVTVVDSSKDLTGLRNLTITGELDAATLDISGNVDVDGTLETDALTIDGVTLAETISDTVGAMVGSNTETGISVTYDDSDNTLDFVIGSGSIASSMIAADAITGAKIADDAINSEHYTDGSIDTAHIADDQVTQAKIADDAVGADQLASNAVVTASITDGNVTTDKIADDAVTLAKMAGLARGKIIVGDSSGNPTALALGSSGEFLKSDGSDLVFGAATISSLAADDLSAGDAAINLTTTSGNITIDAQAGDSDIIFKGTDGSSDTTFLTLDGSDAGTAIFNHDVQLKSDASILSFGADNEITLTHNADVGLTLKNANTGDDKPVILALHTGETDIAANDVLGAIEFKAPDEGTGTDAIAKAAHIQAVSEGDFSATSNATRIEFGTGASESATTKMSLTSGGNLVIGSTSSTAGRLEIAGSNGTIGGVAGIARFLTGASAGGAIDVGDDSSTFQCGSDGTDAFIGSATDIRIMSGASERMRVESTGHVGVGVTDPANSGFFGGTQVSLNVGGTTAPEVRIKSSSGDCDTVLVASNSSNQFFIANGANGVVLAHDGTSFGSASDENLKTIIEDIESAETKINSLRAVIGRYKEVLYTKDILYDDLDVEIPDGKKIGDVKVAKGSVKQKADADTKRRSFLIAQDVQKVLPEAVSEVVGQDNETYLNMSYTDVIPLLVAGIKELSAKCADYEKRIKALESA